MSDRALIAMQVLAALAGCRDSLGYGTYGQRKTPWEWTAREAVEAADALLAELDKEVANVGPNQS